MKRYKAVFFDWDGTAVRSRTAPADAAADAMKPLLARGVRLCVVSGTTYENLADGHLEAFFSPAERENLFLGLARGAQNWGFDHSGKRVLLGGVQPDRAALANIHQVCFDIHQTLFQKYGFNTDIVFGRPNYCKIDLLSGVDRGEHLFFQAGEAEQLCQLLNTHGFSGGLQALIQLAEEAGAARGLAVKPTTDAKYLEVGLSTKSDNADFLLERLGLAAKDCCFWGDEFLDIGDGIFGSDAFMRTAQTAAGDFFDVSDTLGRRPDGITSVGGGVESFLQFLLEQNLLIK